MKPTNFTEPIICYEMDNTLNLRYLVKIFLNYLELRRLLSEQSYEALSVPSAKPDSRDTSLTSFPNHSEIQIQNEIRTQKCEIL